jgi:hypothetical protein
MRFHLLYHRWYGARLAMPRQRRHIPPGGELSGTVTTRNRDGLEDWSHNVSAFGKRQAHHDMCFNGVPFNNKRQAMTVDFARRSAKAAVDCRFPWLLAAPKREHAQSQSLSVASRRFRDCKRLMPPHDRCRFRSRSYYRFSRVASSHDTTMMRQANRRTAFRSRERRDYRAARA